METDEEWHFVMELIQKIRIRPLDEWYVGLSKVATDQWWWVSGKPLNITHWQKGEPSGDGLCVVMAKDYPPLAYGEFNDLDCQAKRGFICEIPILEGKSDLI